MRACWTDQTIPIVVVYSEWTLVRRLPVGPAIELEVELGILVSLTVRDLAVRASRRGCVV